MKRRFKIKLDDALRGLSPYAIAKKINVSENTVRRYTTGTVIVNYIPMTAVLIAEYLGVNWRDGKVIAIVEENEEGESSPEQKPPLPAVS